MTATDPVQARGLDLPWLAEPFARLCQAQRAGALAHGLLLSGPAGVGKRALAAALGRAWLCEADTHGRPCDDCRGCHLTAAGSHPDLHRVVPAEGKSAIAIDQVRDLARVLALQSHAGGSKVAVVAPAHTMTVAAQNSLLKTLEEPVGDALLVLVSEADRRLAATIRSRCQRVGVAPPAHDVALAWLAAAGWSGEDREEALQLAGNAPLFAAELLETGFVETVTRLAEDVVGIARGRAEPVEVAGRWDKQAVHSQALVWLQGTMSALARALLVPEAAAIDRLPAARGRVVSECLPYVQGPALFSFVDELGEAVAALTGQAAPRLVLERVLIAWAGITRRARMGGKRR